MSNPPPAVVLAAGKGMRLAPRTDRYPKPLSMVGDTAIIDNLLTALSDSGVSEVVIVAGHLADVLEDHVRELALDCTVHFVINERYAHTNNIYSLWVARDYLFDGFMLFEADVFFDKGLIDDLVTVEHSDVLVVDRFRPPMNGTVVTHDAHNVATGMFLGSDMRDPRERAYDKTVNFYRFGPAYSSEILLPGLANHIRAGNVNSYYEVVVRESIARGERLFCLHTGRHRWWEIDDERDLATARRLFAVPRRFSEKPAWS